MIRAIVIDDEQPSLHLMQRLLTQYKNIELLGTFHDPIEALLELERLKPDAAFVDIEMPELNGLNWSKRAAQIQPHLQVVFATAYDRYAIDAFKVNATDYLMKPIEETELTRVIDKLSLRVQQTKEPILQREPLAFVESEDDQKNLLFDSFDVTQFRVNTFGRFATYHGEQLITLKWHTEKTEELFVFLLLHPAQKFRKDELCDILWPELSEDRAIKNLYNTVYRLKKSLHDVGITLKIISNNKYYYLESWKYQLDLRDLQQASRFTEPISEEQLNELERLVYLFSGTVLADKDYAWRYTLEETMKRKYFTCVELLAETYLKSNAIQKAIDLCLGALQIHGGEERISRLLFRAYAEQGDLDSIREYAERLSQTLRANGVRQMTVETMQLIEKLLN